MRAMLGLRGSSARSQTPVKTEQPAANLPPHTPNNGSNGRVHEDSATPRSLQNQSSSLLSPSLSATIPLPKRYASHPRRSNVGRVVSGQSASVHFVQEQYASIRQRSQRELGASVGLFAFDTSYTGLSDWIKEERMARLPHKGGAWDRVLISAHYFAAQVDRLSGAIAPFTPDCESASNLLYGQCLLLLELGHENATALQTAFDLFYQLGLELAPLLGAGHALSSSPSIMENVNRAFSELLSVVSGVAVGYYSAVHRSGQTTTRLDIYGTFGASIDNYRSRVHHCETEIWNLELRTQGYDDATQIEILEEWLAPQDKVLAFLSSNKISLATRPEDYTCIWFQPYLNQFFKHDRNVLLVEGKSGAGKTTLANWAVSRLQRPIGGRVVPTLSFFFDSSIAARASGLSMLKTLLFQLLSFRIGELDLFNLILQAYTDAKSIRSAEALEEKLWETLGQALNNISSEGDEVVIIVDGLDGIDGQKPAAKKVAAKLQKLAQEAAGLRVLLFTQALDIDTSAVEKIELTLDYVYDDLQTILHQGLLRYPHFSHKDDIEQEMMVENLLNITDGSLLFATLIIEYLGHQKTPDGFNGAVDALQEAPPKNLSELVQRFLGIAKLDKDARSVLSFLVAAKRPLSLTEIEILLRSDASKTPNVEKPVRLGHIIQSIAAFTVTVEGLVTIRHDAIKQALLNIPDSSDVSLHLKERHKDLLIRLLSATGRYLRDVDEPRLELLPSFEVEKRLASHHLLEYTIRYWVVHFKLSSLFKIQGDVKFPEEFTSVFPKSVTFALLEATRWRSQCLPDEVVELYTIAYRVRKQLFGPEHPSVLQSAITCAIFYETVLTRLTEATEWYALVVRIGKTVLGVQAELVVTCCTTLLRISETLITKTRTQITTYREEILLVLITAYTHQYGPSSPQVIEKYEELIELYLFVGEETKTEQYRIKIREIRTGSRDVHVEQDSFSRHLDVIIKGHKGETEVDGFDSLLFGYEEETEEAWSITHVEKMIQLAIELIKRQQFSSAEEIYVELWLKLSDYCLTTQVIEWHEKKISVMLQYASFLREQKRVEEASAVLTCCWDEYSNHHVSMHETIIVLLKELAVSLKIVGMVSLSLTVFQRCWSWFKSTHKEESHIFKEIVEQIAITSSEVVKTSSSSTTTSTSTTSSSETVIREVFESALSSSEESTTVTTQTMEMCNSLTAIYFEQEKWSEAVSVIRSTLKKTWSSFFAESIESVSTTFTSESVKLVLDLAQSYISQKRYDRAEFTYLRLYRVHCKALKFDDAAVVRFRETYINFLIKHEMHSVLITFYQELLVEYRSFYGPDNAKTIAILYALGDLCRSHHLTHGYWIEYYTEIIVTLNKGARICHENALRALIIVAEYYYELHRYSESLVYLKSIIATFCQFGTKYEVFKETVFVKKTFERYYKASEETQIEIHEHVEILKEIRQACSKFFGESSEIAISSTLVLAEVCSKSEKYEYEAMSYYEHILKHSSSQTVSTTTVKRSQATLRSLYVKQITSSSTSTKVTKETIEKATSMTYERYSETKKSHSVIHESTLSLLSELVVLYQKQERTDLATKELQSLTSEVILSTATTKELIETARYVARIFASSYTSFAVQLIREIKLQVIYKTVSKTAQFNVTKAGRSSFAFIASLEYYLGARTGGTIASYMAEILAEYLFYERLTLSIKRKTKIENIILLGARVRYIQYRTQRAEDFQYVEQKVIDYFTSVEVAVVKGSNQASVRGFVRILLAYFSDHAQPKHFVASAARAAVAELKEYLKLGKYKEALGLAHCIFHFLMTHEGLDDPTEITLGFQLVIMLSGRGEYKRTTVTNETKEMLALSQVILGEIFDICKKNNIDLYRCPLTELNELVSLLGDLNDHRRQLWLLESLWTSRGGQQWPSDVKLTLGTRLVQARCVVGDLQIAIKLAEDIAYNLRRTSGPRDRQTLAMLELVASIYTSAGNHFIKKAGANGASAADKKRDTALSKNYFRKAVTANEELLKVLVETDPDDSDDDDDDTFSVASGSIRGQGNAYSLSRRISSRASMTLLQQTTKSDLSSHKEGEVTSAVAGHQQQLAPREVLVEVARKHLRFAKLAVQRYGGWDPRTRRQFDGTTRKVWGEFGSELALKEEQALSAKWKVDGFGNGKAEGGIEEDGFVVPQNWAIY
ncbi:hypothetical protein F4777DRAFT_404878 [Nemania sp. FL0916]|nr:hypothetical protein F4777DRAFT_404878 [Nemania sp. FL0916]